MPGFGPGVAPAGGFGNATPGNGSYGNNLYRNGNTSYGNYGSNQVVPAGYGGPPGSPGAAPPPGLFPAGSESQQPLIPSGYGGLPQGYVAQPQEIALPYPENKIPINVNELAVKRLNYTWQLWLGQRLLRDFGESENDARDALLVYRDLRPTEWVTIGVGKPVVEYGLVNGKPSLTAVRPGQEDPRGQFPLYPVGDNRPVATGAGARQVQPIDLRTVRVEPIQGVWCLRDDVTLHLNFGANKADADQALAAVRRYGFNRLATVGTSGPAMTYLFASLDTAPPPAQTPLVRAALQHQIETLTKVGIPVAGVGYVGEMIRFDPKTIAARRDNGEWLVSAGGEVIGRFGPTEWVAREAVRTLQDMHVSEFCRVGSAGVTFFLSGGRAPTNAPFSVQGRAFDPSALKVSKVSDRWAITENGRFMFNCASAEEGDILIRLIHFFQFNQLCHLGPSPTTGVSFLARGR